MNAVKLCATCHGPIGASRGPRERLYCSKRCCVLASNMRRRGARGPSPMLARVRTLNDQLAALVPERWIAEQIAEPVERGGWTNPEREQRNARMVRDYVHGASLEHVAERAGVAPSTAYLILRERNIAIRHKERSEYEYVHAPRTFMRLRGRELRKARARLLDAYRAGLPIKRIAERFGCSVAEVSKIAHAHGLNRKAGPRVAPPELRPLDDAPSVAATRRSRRRRRSPGVTTEGFLELAANDVRKGSMFADKRRGGLVLGVTRHVGGISRNPAYSLSYAVRRALRRTKGPSDVTVYDAAGNVVRVLDGTTGFEKR